MSMGDNRNPTLRRTSFMRCGDSCKEKRFFFVCVVGLNVKQGRWCGVINLYMYIRIREREEGEICEVKDADRLKSITKDN